MEILGQWCKLNNEALHIPEPTDIEIKDKPYNFILRNDNNYYLFMCDLSINGDDNVTIKKEFNCDNVFSFDKNIRSVCWLDNGEELKFTQNDREVNVQSKGFEYGEDFIVRIAKIEV